MPSFEYYNLEVKGAIAYVTLNRPDRLNTMGLGPWKEMQLVQDEIENNRDIRVVIIKADGEHFSAGIDLHDLEEVNSHWVADNIHWLQRLTLAGRTECIVIAAGSWGLLWSRFRDVDCL